MTASGALAWSWGAVLQSQEVSVKAKSKTCVADPVLLRVLAGVLRALATALEDMASGRPPLVEEAKAALQGVKA